MSIDRMGSMLAGAERLASRGGQFAERAPRVLSSVQRIGDRLQMLSRAESAARMVNAAQNLSGRVHGIKLWDRYPWTEENQVF